MSPYVDFHTHLNFQSPEVVSVYNLMLHEKVHTPTGKYSAGLHPWFADYYSCMEISIILEECACDNHLIAFGETGLDKSCQVPLQVQQDIFEIHLKKAVEKSKPVVLHCVRAWDEIIEQTSGFPGAKVLHGYNGTVELTKRLLNHNFLFSIGTAIINPTSKINRSLLFIPVKSIFCETDTSKYSIQNIYASVSDKLNMNDGELRKVVFANFNRL